MHRMHPQTRRSVGIVLVGMVGLLLGSRLEAQAPPEAKVRKKTVLGSVFAVDPRFEPMIADRIEQARSDLRKQRLAGKFTAYLSCPISARGGGYEPTNLEISAFTKQRLEARSGGRVWYLNPGNYQIGRVGGREPEGGEFLWMWTQILAGEDGLGNDFDLVYFLGPSDAAAFFATFEQPGDRPGDGVDRYIERQTSDDFKRAILADPVRLAEFRRFYLLRASVAWSKGAHDEWNIFVRINRRRGVGEQIPIYFDGRPVSPAEMETEIAPGYEIKP